MNRVLDTNILAYAVDRDGDERHERSRILLGRAARCDSALTVQALAEFLHDTTRKSLLPFTSASGLVRGWLEVFHVVSAGAETIVEAMDAVEEHRLSFRNATLWATAQQSGCSVILTEDMQDGRRLGGVEFINPFTTEAAARFEPPLQS